MGEPNRRTFVKGHVKLEAVVYDRLENEAYFYLILTDPNHADTPEFYIELDHTKIKISDCTVEMIRPSLMLDQAVSTFSDYPPGSRYWTVKGQDFESPSYWFVVNDDTILAFMADVNSILWNRDMKKFTFPMSRQDAIELLGQPDDIYDWLVL